MERIGKIKWLAFYLGENKKYHKNLKIKYRLILTELFTLWLGKTNEICRICILSWIKLGYKPIIYVDFDNLDSFFIENNSVILKDYREVLNDSTENILQFSDYFRYLRLYNLGGCWLDADMFLLKKIPEEDIIIGSERTCQSGAFKNKIKEIANIAYLKFPIGDSLLEYCINKIQKSKSKSQKVQKNMFIFQDALHRSTLFNDYK